MFEEVTCLDALAGAHGVQQRRLARLAVHGAPVGFGTVLQQHGDNVRQAAGLLERIPQRGRAAVLARGLGAALQQPPHQLRLFADVQLLVADGRDDERLARHGGAVAARTPAQQQIRDGQVTVGDGVDQHVAAAAAARIGVGAGIEKHAHHFNVLGGAEERAAARVADAARFGAVRDEQFDHGYAVAADGGDNGCPARRVCRFHVAAVLEEQTRAVDAARLNHVVKVRRAVWGRLQRVAAMVEEHLRHAHLARGSGLEQRRQLSRAEGAFEVCAAFDQHGRDGNLVGLDGDVHRRVAVLVLAVNVGALLEEAFHKPGVTAGARLAQRAYKRIRLRQDRRHHGFKRRDKRAEAAALCVIGIGVWSLR